MMTPYSTAWTWATPCKCFDTPDENLLSDQRYKRAPTIPALSQSAAQNQRVNCK